MSEQQPRVVLAYEPDVPLKSRISATARFVEFAQAYPSGAAGSAPQPYVVDVHFPGHSESVSIGVELLDEPTEIHLLQVDAGYAVGHVHHGTHEEQCTVFCPKSGERRSGRNVCIECRGRHGTVKICC